MPVDRASQIFPISGFSTPPPNPIGFRPHAVIHRVGRTPPFRFLSFALSAPEDTSLRNARDPPLLFKIVQIFSLSFASSFPAIEVRTRIPYPRSPPRPSLASIYLFSGLEQYFTRIMVGLISNKFAGFGPIHALLSPYRGSIFSKSYNAKPLFSPQIRVFFSIFCSYIPLSIGSKRVSGPTFSFPCRFP